MTFFNDSEVREKTVNSPLFFWLCCYLFFWIKHRDCWFVLVTFITICLIIKDQTQSSRLRTKLVPWWPFNRHHGHRCYQQRGTLLLQCGERCSLQWLVMGNLWWVHLWSFVYHWALSSPPLKKIVLYKFSHFIVPFILHTSYMSLMLDAKAISTTTNVPQLCCFWYILLSHSSFTYCTIIHCTYLIHALCGCVHCSRVHFLSMLCVGVCIVVDVYISYPCSMSVCALYCMLNGVSLQFQLYVRVH